MPIAPVLVLRALAIGVALALAVALLRAPARARRVLLPLLLCVMAYLLRAAPEMAQAPVAVLLPLSIGALGFPVAFWWLVRNGFEDKADVPPLAWVAAGSLLLTGLMRTSLLPGAAQAVPKLVAAGFVLLALWRLWATRSGDLVASRRKLRGWLLGYIGLHGLAVLMVELQLQGTAAPAWLDSLNVAVILAGLLVGAACLTGADTRALDTLFGTEASAQDKPAPAMEPRAEADGTDAHLLQRLEQLMTVDCLYRDPELTLAGLAQRLGLPEYRLRELINRQLGYRNFAAFINEHRLLEVEQRLADPACDRRPILTLALEAGFGSIGPFNRSFKDRQGITPRAFREQRRAAPQTD
ncbi:helix-turn-helix transcriptional regulator [Aquincola sp. S2]|uniref:Helix-turn-helix transcriptional regulator n=1 Tax=Pseudaquabacterium terrae TaxID=2732868 RepID=A0ABX2ESV6_9BURK|nr:helix-turn-helix domain-containing protein [Aquabacterium terrae]NRF71624.1 helix-turn-helix transcriptional regulator [Aquabacterium terrae]